MNLKRNMRDWLKDTGWGVGVECPLPLLYQCTPFEAYSGCVELVTLLGREFHPHLDETYLLVPTASRDLLQVCQTLSKGHW